MQLLSQNLKPLDFEIISLFTHYFTATVTALTRSYSALLLRTALNVLNCSALLPTASLQACHLQETL
jgi:hypothetical protein